METWIQQDKLQASEELGDLLKKFDMNLAIVIYKKCNAN